MGGHLTCLAAAATGWNEQQVETGLGSAYNLIWRDMERCFTTEMSPKCVDSVDSVRNVSGRYQMVAIFIWMKAVAPSSVM